jgi:hypothetical protein
MAKEKKKRKGKPKVWLTDRELATVLAALRYWQDADAKAMYIGEIVEVANGGGKFERLDENEIDQLCERLNFGDKR